MSQNDTTPIVVNSSNTPTTVSAAVGQMIPVVATMVAAYAHLQRADVVVLLSGAVVIANALWRVWVARHNHARLVTTALASPDSIAQVK